MRLGLITAIALAGATAANAQGNAVAGERAFKRCTACHQVGAGAKNAVGPVLNGVIGRTAGAAPGYKYSPSMSAAGDAGLIWTKETLADYIGDPSGFLRTYLSDPKAKARMRFRLKNAQARTDVAAYLASLP